MSLARWLGQAAAYLVPKSRIALLNGQPAYCDDVLALERVLSGAGVRKVVILCASRREATERTRYADLDPRTVTVAKRTPMGVYYALAAKYVFFTHSAPIHRYPKSVESVNVWHGMPVKRVGWMTKSGGLLPVVKYSVATSPFWQVVVQESLRPTVQTLVTGLPRNDRLRLGDRGVLKQFGYAAAAGTKMIAWLPTYRGDWTGGDLRTHCSHVLGLSADQLRVINDMLEKHDALLVVKRHPLAESMKTPELSRIRYVSDRWLHERGLTLHELLGESYALVTDVSSAYIDYLLLDRPIVHHFPDIQQYGESRGYSFTPIEEYLAGPVVDDPAGLADALSAVLQGKDAHAEQRCHVKELFHDPEDGSAAERLASALGLL